MTDAEVKAGYHAVRKYIDASGYGYYVSDDACMEVTRAVLSAAEAVRPIPMPAPEPMVERHVTERLPQFSFGNSA